MSHDKSVVGWGFTQKPVGEAEKRDPGSSQVTMLVQTSSLAALLVITVSGSPQKKVRFILLCKISS